MYSVLISRQGLPAVVSQNSMDYVDMIRSGNYTENFSGTKKECHQQEEALLELVANHLLED